MAELFFGDGGGYEVAAASRPARGRPGNEDSYCVGRGADGSVCVAVVDGMGMTGGDDLHWFSEAVARKAVEGLAAYGDPVSAMESLEDYVAFSGASGGSYRAAVLLAAVAANEVELAWKGDVAAFCIGGPGKAARQATFPHRDGAGVITRYLGGDSPGDVSALRQGVSAGDILLFATDGVTLSLEAMSEAFAEGASLQSACDAVLRMSSSSDDATVVALRKAG